MTTWRFSSWLALCVALGFFAVACGDDGMGDDDDDMMGDDDDDDMMADDDDDDVALTTIRAVHLAQGAGNVDVYVGDLEDPVASDVAYLDVVGPAELPVETPIRVFAAGADPSSADPVVEVNAPRTAGVNSTIIVRIGPSDQVVAQVFDDARIPEPDDAVVNVSVRFVNATAPNSGVAPDIDLNTVIDSESTLQAGATSDLEFGQNTGTIGILGPPPEAEFLGAFNLRDLDLAAGERSYLFITGDANGGRLDPDGITLFYLTTGSEADEDALRPIPLPAELRALHLSPNAPAVDVYGLNPTSKDVPLIDDLQFGQASAYIRDVDITSGFEIYLGDAVIGEKGVEPLFVINADGEEILTENKSPYERAQDRTRHTIVVSGDAGEEPAEGTELDWELFLDDVDPSAGNFLGRVFHTSFAEGAQGVKLDLDGDGTPDTDAINFGASTEAELPSPAQITVFDGEDNRVTSLTIPQGTVARGSAGYVAVVGDPALHPSEDDALAILVADTTSGESRIPPLPSGLNADLDRFAQDTMLWLFHGVPDVANPVDIVIDPGGDRETALMDVTFGQLSGRQQISPGDTMFEVQVDGTPVSMDETAFPFSDGMRYLVAVTGLANADPTDPEGATIVFQVYDDGFDRTNEVSAQVRVVHGSPDAPQVDGGTVTNFGSDTFSPIAAFAGLNFGEASASAGAALGPVISPDTVSLGVIVTGSMATTPAIVWDGVTDLLAGSRVFAVVSGELTPESAEQPLTLFTIETGMGPWSISSGIVGRPGIAPE